MPRQCSVCTHPKRTAIDRALTDRSASNRRIASQHGLTERAIRYHKEHHLKDRLRKAAERDDDADLKTAIDVKAQLQAINATTLEVLAEARKARDGDLALKAVDRVQKQLEMQAKLIGDLTDGPTINVLVNPQWIAVRSLIIHALADHPAARLAVAEALASLDAGETS